MTTYRTGNAIGSTDPRDLYDNAQNLDEAVNSSADTFQDRLGKSRLTWAGIVKAGSGDPAIAVDAAARAESAASSVEQNAEQIAQDAAQQAASSVIADVGGYVSVAQNAADRAEAASSAAFVNADVYETRQAGADATVPGQQFQVVDGIEIVRYRREVGSTVEVARYPSSKIDSLTVNSGKPFPLSQITLGGVTSDEKKEWSDLILAAEVIGARRGKLYQLGFYQNGAVLGGEPGYGWVIREHDASDPDNVVGGPRIENREQLEELIDRAGGVQTIRIVPTHRPEMEFKLTVDADQLPPDGSSIDSNSDIRDGWSWIIDPSCYTYPQPVSVNYESQVGVAWEVSGGDMVVTYPSSGHYYRITFGPNGFNNLPNFKKVETSSDGVSWSILTNTTTDWLPPIQLEAVNNGDGGTRIYTGGNHGSSGGADGEQTARNIHFVVAPDGRPVTSDDAGQAAEVVVTVVNEVMAYNTITLGRYVLRETFKLSFYAGGCSVTAVRVPYEALTLGNDNGLQATTDAFQNSGTYMIYGGQQGRVVFDENRLGAGSASEHPDAWATVFQESSAGQFAVWMDREFGVGTGTFNPSTHVRFGSGTNWKIYNNVAGFSDTPLEAGAAYTWRGGYAWMMPEALSGLDSMFLYRNAGEAKAAYAVDNQDWWKL